MLLMLYTTHSLFPFHSLSYAFSMFFIPARCVLCVLLLSRSDSHLLYFFSFSLFVFSFNLLFFLPHIPFYFILYSSCLPFLNFSLASFMSHLLQLLFSSCKSFAPSSSFWLSSSLLSPYPVYGSPTSFPSFFQCSIPRTTFTLVLLSLTLISVSLSFSFSHPSGQSDSLVTSETSNIHEVIECRISLWSCHC